MLARPRGADVRVVGTGGSEGWQERTTCIRLAGSASKVSFYQVSISNLVPTLAPPTLLTPLSVLSASPGPHQLSWPEREATSGLQSTEAPCFLLSLAWSKLQGWRRGSGVRGHRAEELLIRAVLVIGMWGWGYLSHQSEVEKPFLGGARGRKEQKTGKERESEAEPEQNPTVTPLPGGCPCSHALDLPASPWLRCAGGRSTLPRWPGSR